MITSTIAVDVDGTLVIDGAPNRELIVWLHRQRAAGQSLLLWSARGKGYALTMAALCGVSDLFDVILGKPDVCVDDRGWTWVRFSRVLVPGRQEDFA